MVTDFKFEERRVRTNDGSPAALADQIERFGRALTAAQLSALLSVSKIDVRVHQLVKSLGGDVLSDSEVCHAYTIADGLINGWTSEEAKQTLSRARPQRSPIAKRRRDSRSDLHMRLCGLQAD